MFLIKVINRTMSTADGEAAGGGITQGWDLSTSQG